MSFIQCHFRSYELGFNVSLNVILPEPVKSNEKFKVLYLLHGYIGDHTDWMRYSSIERYASQYRLAVVMPGVNNSYYTDTTYGQPFFTFIAKELQQFVQNTFSISKKACDTFVGGLSMGGYGAIKLALTYPKKFGKAFSLSGALDIENIRNMKLDPNEKKLFDGVFGKKVLLNTKNDLFYLAKKFEHKKNLLPNLLIICGREDFLYQDNLNFVKLLSDLKLDHLYEELPGTHET
jgi:putative tributyrin esterase